MNTLKVAKKISILADGLLKLGNLAMLSLIVAEINFLSNKIFMNRFIEISYPIR